MKRSFILGLVLICVLATGLYAGAGREAAAAGPIKLVWSTASVPGDAHTEAMYVFKEEVERLSSLSITVDIFHSSQLFDQNSDKDALIQGKIDMAYTSASWLAQDATIAAMSSRSSAVREPVRAISCRLRASGAGGGGSAPQLVPATQRTGPA